MSSADKQELNDDVLSRYLLGSLPAEETERLHELSIADDEFALRLDAVENDLVDAYTQGDLSGDTLEQFQKFYLSSPKRREKVEFARALLRCTQKTAPAVTRANRRPAIPNAHPRDETLKGRSPRRWFTVPRLGLQWGFAAAALVMLPATIDLFVENERLERQATEVRNQQAILNQHAGELEKQLGEQRAANTRMLEELDRLRAALPVPHALKIVAALLLPQMRGANQIPTVSVPAGTDQIQLRLQLESDDFPSYQVALKDAAGTHVLWRKSGLKARAEGNAKVISINVPASRLERQNYVVELTGVSASGGTEFVTGYPVKVVPE